jgi:hypothetical protein
MNYFSDLFHMAGVAGPQIGVNCNILPRQAARTLAIALFEALT